jgi:hypothetical protein
VESNTPDQENWGYIGGSRRPSTGRSSSGTYPVRLSRLLGWQNISGDARHYSHIGIGRTQWNSRDLALHCRCNHSGERKISIVADTRSHWQSS